MFCFHKTFSRRERGKKLKRNCFSESERSLNKIKYEPQYFCLSDPNLTKIDVNLESKNWERWRARTQSRYHANLLLKNKNGCQRKKFVEKNNSLKVDQHLTFGESLPDSRTKNLKGVIPFLEVQKTGMEEDINTFNQSHSVKKDTECVDESGNVFKNLKPPVNEKTEFVNNTEINSSSELAETKLSKFSDSCSNKEMSIIGEKAMNNDSIHSGIDTHMDIIGDHKEEIVLKCETVHNYSENNDLVKNFKSHLSEESKGNIDELETFFNETAVNKPKQVTELSSGTSILSICSLFNSFGSSNKDSDRTNLKEDKVKICDQSSSVMLTNKSATVNWTCCPLSFQQNEHLPVQTLQTGPDHSDNIVISTSPVNQNRPLLSEVFSSGSDDSYESKSVSFSGDSSSTSSESSMSRIAPIASPEMISSGGSVSSIPISCVNSGYVLSQGMCNVFNDNFHKSNRLNSLSFGYMIPQTKFKLLHEGDIQICHLSHMRTIKSKVLGSKLFRRWENHHIYLSDDSISSRTPSGFLESPVSYSNLDEVCVLGSWDQGNRFCIRLVMTDGSLLLQASNSLIRDQWLASILWKKNMHKYRNILQSSTRPEVILKEIKNLVYFTLNSPIQDDSVANVPIEIISKVLDEADIWNDCQHTEEAIIVLAPLLEGCSPSAEMFQFFSRHCLRHPRSPVIVDILTPLVHRILKRTVDFGKTPLMRRFVADYLKAVHSKNDGDEAIRRFVASIHGPTCSCPHPRVLPNLVAVNLSTVFSNFEQRKSFLTEARNELNCADTVQLLDKQLHCCVTLFRTISEYEDWRPGLAQLLQPIPLPDDALHNDKFVRDFTPVIENIAKDPRCSVHEMVLGIRENKEGWLNVFCPSSLACKDGGVVWCQMLETLFSCCCKRKSFLQKMVKHLGALSLVALRNHSVAQEILCLMLEWRLITEEDQEMQVITTLQSTESGRQKYNQLSKRQEHLKELQKKGGPKKLTLPSRSTDADVTRLLSCGSFGNLECLSLAFTHVTSACAYQLIQLPALRYLNLWATQFGDAGLMVIAEHLDKLQVLNLCETPVSDTGIAAITAMKNLRKLNLNSTKLSPHTLDVLKQNLPTLQELDVRYTDAW